MKLTVAIIALVLFSSVGLVAWRTNYRIHLMEMVIKHQTFIIRDLVEILPAIAKIRNSNIKYVSKNKVRKRKLKRKRKRVRRRRKKR